VGVATAATDWGSVGTTGTTMAASSPPPQAARKPSVVAVTTLQIERRLACAAHHACIAGLLASERENFRKTWVIPGKILGDAQEMRLRRIKRIHRDC